MNKSTFIHKAADGFMTLFLVLFFVVLLYGAVRIFLVESYRVPSSSMEPQLMAGDYIWVLKPIYGARLLDSLSMNEQGFLSYSRLKGLRAVERNDVLVANRQSGNPKQPLGTFYVKRCIAVPGDTLRIENGFYQIAGCDESVGDIEQQERLSKTNPKTMEYGVLHCIGSSWTILRFGPLYLPKANETVQLDTLTCRWYRPVIERETGKRLTADSLGVIRLGGETLTEYRFGSDCYFLGGDHVLNSCDSRYMGLFSEPEIVARVWCVWASFDPYNGEFRWDRWFKNLL